MHYLTLGVKMKRINFTLKFIMKNFHKILKSKLFLNLFVLLVSINIIYVYYCFFLITKSPTIVFHGVIVTLIAISFFKKTHKFLFGNFFINFIVLSTSISLLGIYKEIFDSEHSVLASLFFSGIIAILINFLWHLKDQDRFLEKMFDECEGFIFSNKIILKKLTLKEYFNEIAKHIENLENEKYYDLYKYKIKTDRRYITEFFKKSYYEDYDIDFHYINFITLQKGSKPHEIANDIFYCLERNFLERSPHAIFFKNKRNHC